VLRKKPPGMTLPSAHAVEREAALFLGLGESSSSSSSSPSSLRVPVPRVLALETSDRPLGTPFYVMEFVAGRVFADPALPGLDEERRGGGGGGKRRALYAAAAEALARIHSVDVPSSPTLSKLLLSSKSNNSGGGINYCARQIQRWERQYLSQAGPGKKRPLLPEMIELISFLKSHIPRADASLEDSGGRPTLVHGDFRIDNLVFDCELLLEVVVVFFFRLFSFASTFFFSPFKKKTPKLSKKDSSPTVLAVLDWELATCGNALADAAYATLPWHLPAGVPALPALPPNKNKLPPGLPTEREFREMYFSARERILQASSSQRGEKGEKDARCLVRRPSEREWSFYVALALFRAAAILAGVGARADEGNAASAGAHAAGGLGVVAALARRALAVVDGACSSPSRSLSPSHSSSGLDPSPEAAALLSDLREFIREKIIPHEAVADAHFASAERWSPIPGLEDLKAEAKRKGLWNLWLPRELAERVKATLREGGGERTPPNDGDGDGDGDSDDNLEALLSDSTLWGPGLTNLDYAHLAQQMGGTPWCPEVFNCSAPDTGNMEVLARCGDARQQRRFLVPLLRGDIRSCFAMTEPAVASSDATNMEATIRWYVRRKKKGGDRSKEEGEEDEIVLNGKKWWTSGALDQRCRLCLFMGKDEEEVQTQLPPKHRRHSIVLVPMPHPGLTVRRALTVFGFDDAPHGHAEVDFNDVRLSLTSSTSSPVVLGRGRGFEIAQARLGPGRLHHCMRLVGAGERALELASSRARRRKAFGGALADLGGFRADLARARVALDGARLLVLHAAHVLDKARGDARAARGALAAAKVAAPRAASAALDLAIQVHGGAGVSQNTPLAALWAGARTLRLADGPDEVHLGTIAGLELRRSGEREAEDEGVGGDRSRL